MATVEVDQDLCIADQVCASMHPDIFEMRDDGKAHVVDGMEDVPDEHLDMVREAADGCPVDAITVHE